MKFTDYVEIDRQRFSKIEGGFTAVAAIERVLAVVDALHELPNLNRTKHVFYRELQRLSKPLIVIRPFPRLNARALGQYQAYGNDRMKLSWWNRIKSEPESSVLWLRCGQVAHETDDGIQWSDHIETTCLHEICHALVAEWLALGNQTGPHSKTDHPSSRMKIVRFCNQFATSRSFTEVRNMCDWYGKWTKDVRNSGGPEEVFPNQMVAQAVAQRNIEVADRMTYLYDPHEWIARLYCRWAIDRGNWTVSERSKLIDQLKAEETDLLSYVAKHKGEELTSFSIYLFDDQVRDWGKSLDSEFFYRVTSNG
jgi:hypothetical protein